MLELISGERGQTVIRREGRLLASRFDPVGEAQAWIARRMTFLDKVKTVFVLGLGAGYHVQALLKATPAQIFVIEPDIDLTALVQTIHSFPKERVTIEAIQTARALRAHAAVRAAIKSSFIVLVHPASRVANADFFEECSTQLSGREWGSLTWQWNLKAGHSLDSTPRVDSTGEVLSIYDLEQTELVQNSEERERLLIKALRELVK